MMAIVGSWGWSRGRDGGHPTLPYVRKGAEAYITSSHALRLSQAGSPNPTPAPPSTTSSTTLPHPHSASSSSALHPPRSPPQNAAVLACSSRGGRRTTRHPWSPI